MLDFYKLIRPVLMSMDPEKAHSHVIGAMKFCLKHRMLRVKKKDDDPILRCRVWNRSFDNPIGLSAGFDKNAEVIDAILGMGFSFVEVGAITPHPQGGKLKPRLFRLPEDEAVINRFGFPNEGLEKISERLSKRASDRRKQAGFVGANIGPNDDTDDRLNDYVQCIEQLTRIVDYFVVNVSCPNTAGLRDLQKPEVLSELLSKLKAARDGENNESPPPILVKISPDLNTQQIADIAEVMLSSRIDGVIATNTTTDRSQGLKSEHSEEEGGLSGRPLFEKSTEKLREMYCLTRGEIPLIGLGGVRSGRDAYIKIRSGASLVQLYTALVYQGPALVSRIKIELANLLQKDGFANIQEAVGVDVPIGSRQQANKKTIFRSSGPSVSGCLPISKTAIS